MIVWQLPTPLWQAWQLSDNVTAFYTAMTIDYWKCGIIEWNKNTTNLMHTPALDKSTGGINRVEIWLQHHMLVQKMLVLMENSFLHGHSTMVLYQSVAYIYNKRKKKLMLGWGHEILEHKVRLEVKKTDKGVMKWVKWEYVVTTLYYYHRIELWRSCLFLFYTCLW